MRNRKAELLKAAVLISMDEGYNTLTYRKVAKKAKTSKTLVCHYFPTVKKLKREVIKEALKEDVLTVIMQAYFLGDIKRDAVTTYNRQRLTTLFDN